MKVTLKANEKTIELDEFLNEEEMKLSPSQFLLAELSQYISGCIELSFCNHDSIILDLFFDFSVCFKDIMDSIKRTKNGWEGEDYIWFCEQGSDFYVFYNIKKTEITIEFKKGKKVGLPNSKINDFKISINSLDYVNEWISAFKRIKSLFKEKLNKDIDLPF